MNRTISLIVLLISIFFHSTAHSAYYSHLEETETGETIVALKSPDINDKAYWVIITDLIANVTKTLVTIPASHRVNQCKVFSGISYDGGACSEICEGQYISDLDYEENVLAYKLVTKKVTCEVKSALVPDQEAQDPYDPMNMVQVDYSSYRVTSQTEIIHLDLATRTETSLSGIGDAAFSLSDSDIFSVSEDKICYKKGPGVVVECYDVNTHLKHDIHISGYPHYMKSAGDEIFYLRYSSVEPLAWLRYSFSKDFFYPPIDVSKIWPYHGRYSNINAAHLGTHNYAVLGIEDGSTIKMLKTDENDPFRPIMSKYAATGELLEVDVTAKGEVSTVTNRDGSTKEVTKSNPEMAWIQKLENGAYQVIYWAKNQQHSIVNNPVVKSNIRIAGDYVIWLVDKKGSNDHRRVVFYNTKTGKTRFFD